MKQLLKPCTEILSPLKGKLTHWSQCLGSHPDTAFSSYIVIGIANGFHIEYHSSTTTKHETATESLPTTMVHPEVVGRGRGELPWTIVPSLYAHKRL